eukprot:TRINITY_DN711_c2_g1_i1.p1 TRINITY_DN711_c2_g1~~TRINITY_DN711_c2_g1_i1.p1  ORF type:complete len:578 (-),score=122.39 TRINITY_DN711_c2_g1_i1:88-1821(-)
MASHTTEMPETQETTTNTITIIDTDEQVSKRDESQAVSEGQTVENTETTQTTQTNVDLLRFDDFISENELNNAGKSTTKERPPLFPPFPEVREEVGDAVQVVEEASPASNSNSNVNNPQPLVAESEKPQQSRSSLLSLFRFLPRSSSTPATPVPSAPSPPPVQLNGPTTTPLTSTSTSTSSSTIPIVASPPPLTSSSSSSSSLVSPSTTSTNVGSSTSLPNLGANGTSSNVTPYSIFLNKLQHPKANELASALKSFIKTFKAKTPPWQTHSDTVRAFLNQMERNVLRHELWRDANENEQENVSEGLEKFVMMNIFACVFEPDPIDLERDRGIQALLLRYQFITPAHLEISDRLVSDYAISQACVELTKINQYKSPRDKIRCIFKCCKSIYQYINSNNFGNPAGADEFLPVLIIVLLRTNPPHLHSNIQYIARFRNPEKLTTESGYYFTQLSSALSFLENLKPSSLKIDPEEFERLVNESINKPDFSRNGTENPTILPTDTNEGYSGFSESDRFTDRTYTTNMALSGSLRYQFANVDAKDLTIAQIYELLDEYKRIIQDNLVLRSELQRLGGSLPPFS